MLRAKHRTTALFVVLAAGVSASCTAVLGFEDLSLAEPDAGGAEEDAGSDANGSQPDVTVDASDDVPDAEADVMDASHEDVGCGDTTQSPDHCGRCNHSCLGGDCADGVCQPFTLASITGSAWGMAVDDTSVFVALQFANELRRLDKTNGAQLVHLSGTPSVAVPSWVAVDDERFYWSNRVNTTGSIGACPLAGCSGEPPKIIDEADRPNGIVAQGDKIYWAETRGGTINKADADGSNPEVLAGSSVVMQPFLITLHGGYVYFSDLEEGRVARTPIDGGTVETMGTSSQPYGVAVTDDWVCWTNSDLTSGSVLRVPNTTPPSGGHPVETVAGNQPGAFGIVADEDNVYWVASASPDHAEGALRYCPMSGCPGAQPIALDEAVAYPIDVVADEHALYYSIYGIYGVHDGEVRKVAKP